LMHGSHVPLMPFSPHQARLRKPSTLKPLRANACFGLTAQAVLLPLVRISLVPRAATSWMAGKQPASGSPLGVDYPLPPRIRVLVHSQYRSHTTGSSLCAAERGDAHLLQLWLSAHASHACWWVFPGLLVITKVTPARPSAHTFSLSHSHSATVMLPVFLLSCCHVATPVHRRRVFLDARRPCT